MDVVETTTDERNIEIQVLFEKLRPFLDQGLSYNKAYESAIGHKPYVTRAWWKDLLKYGQQQGYERRYTNRANKYGLLNVHFKKKKKKWYYHYLVGDKKRYLTSYDLKKLRKNVEDKNMPWVVLDIDLAKQAYQLNDEIQVKREMNQKLRGQGRPNKTGILYVSRLKKKTYRNGYFWRYFNRKQDIHISATTLRELRNKVIYRGYPWIVIDEDKYHEFLEQENVRMNEN